MTSLAELKTLRDKARAMGHTVTLFYNDLGVMDQVYIVLKKDTRATRESSLYDPLGAAECLRQVTGLYTPEQNAAGKAIIDKILRERQR